VDFVRSWLFADGQHDAPHRLRASFVEDGDVSDMSAIGDHLVGSFDNSGDLLGISMQYKF